MDGLRGSRALVTGATGFIGANLVRALLEADAQVHGVARPGSDPWRVTDLPGVALHEVSVTDGERLRHVVHEWEPDFVIHLAAGSGHASTREEREEAIRTIVLGTSNLLEALAPLRFRRLVSVGSGLEYGPSDEPLQEDTPLAPATFRGAAKAAASVLCQQFAREGGRPVVILRPFHVYGYWEASSRLVARAVLSALRGDEMDLTPPGRRRDHVFVEDVVRAIVLALTRESPPGEAINVGSGEEWSNEEIVALIGKLIRRPARVRPGAFPDRPSDLGRRVASIEKARRLLDWEPRHTLRQGLEKTVAWFAENLHRYDARMVRGRAEG